VSVHAVEIRAEYPAPGFPTRRMQEAVEYVLAKHEVEPGTGLTIVITDDERVRRLNREYRGVDAPTDVLSFPADPLPDEVESEPPYLGDLIMAYPYTAHQAEDVGHPLDDEFVLMAIHGTLHLLGYDHDKAESEEAMWSEQANALAAAGVNIEVPRFTFGDNVGS
jgi:probable rRNA maturation factor